MTRRRHSAAPAAGLAAVIAAALASAAPACAEEARPQPVVIEGWTDHAMEPFLSRDGRTLFFNNRNHPPEITDLHWAERIDDLRLRYRGPIAGANSPALDAVPTLAADGRFCFVSLRDYQATSTSVFCGTWTGEGLAGVSRQDGASVNIHGRIVFDVDLSADGETLILADGQFTGGPLPAASDLRAARRVGGGYRLAPEDDPLFAALNSSALEYAAALSPDGLTLAFTRLYGIAPFARTSIWLSHRSAVDEPFASPVRLKAAAGFVEAATFTPDGRALYYHKRQNGKFRLQRIELAPTSAPASRSR